VKQWLKKTAIHKSKEGMLISNQPTFSVSKNLFRHASKGLFLLFQHYFYCFLW